MIVVVRKITMNNCASAEINDVELCERREGRRRKVVRTPRGNERGKLRRRQGRGVTVQ